MPIEDAVVERIRVLIEKGYPISPVGKKGYALTYDESHATSGWLTSAINAVKMIDASVDGAYRSKCLAVEARYSTAVTGRDSRDNDIKSQCVGEMVSVLENLLTDINAGLISSLADRIRAETFDDFLEHAIQYHKEGRKEAGVIAGVVFEDTIRRIAKRLGIENRSLEDTINDLVKKEVFNQATAKRAKAAAHVRTKATHALWDEFELEDVSATINLTRELISVHLER